MPIYTSNITISGGSSIAITDSNNNNIFNQLSTGQITMPTASSGAARIPLFSVGWNAGWTDVGGIIPFSYTGANGYINVGNCFNTTTYAFTAPWSGLYLFKENIYIYGPNATQTWYTHPLFLVNGSSTARRPGGTPYRIRLYGLRADNGHDTDCSELIYLLPGDYVQVQLPRSGTVQGYGQYSNFIGCYLGA